MSSKTCLFDQTKSVAKMILIEIMEIITLASWHNLTYRQIISFLHWSFKNIFGYLGLQKQNC